ncbi:hypothetical protein DPEC_G00345950 [Dallia pectoralis]|uniref:Uncharacterized protein n=1 Tax=Dallia pectoralis TaxID=75939 RepID=A0ACC2F3X2_DALPE|nr:hypothetical protein DPEC_G00345950 [Dallia pectoralis]
MPCILWLQPVAVGYHRHVEFRRGDSCRPGTKKPGPTRGHTVELNREFFQRGRKSRNRRSEVPSRGRGSAPRTATSIFIHRPPSPGPRIGIVVKQPQPQSFHLHGLQLLWMGEA